MTYVRFALISVPVLMLAACGGGTPGRHNPVRAGCEDATGQGVAPGRASARAVAEASLRHQAHDLRGYIIKDGYFGVRVGAPRVSCSAYPLGLGLTQCVAQASLCGR